MPCCILPLSLSHRLQRHNAEKQLRRAMKKVKTFEQRKVAAVARNNSLLTSQRTTGSSRDQASNRCHDSCKKGGRCQHHQGGLWHNAAPIDWSDLVCQGMCLDKLAKEAYLLHSEKAFTKSSAVRVSYPARGGIIAANSLDRMSSVPIHG